MKVIYIVFGETGDHDESHKWPVRAFASAEEAEALRDLCNEYVTTLGDPYSDEYTKRVRTNPHDPDMTDYGSTSYNVYPVPFGPEAPKP